MGDIDRTEEEDKVIITRISEKQRKINIAVQYIPLPVCKTTGEKTAQFSMYIGQKETKSSKISLSRKMKGSGCTYVDYDRVTMTVEMRTYMGKSITVSRLFK